MDTLGGRERDYGVMLWSEGRKWVLEKGEDSLWRGYGGGENGILEGEE